MEKIDQALGWKWNCWWFRPHEFSSKRSPCYLHTYKVYKSAIDSLQHVGMQLNLEGKTKEVQSPDIGNLLFGPQN
jgi:hypothetical protein